uniref:BpiB02 n=1 Tax=uncultured organism Bio4 TaxID=460931 RepID=B2BKA4_9ZZZZ|nr:BpiB02 [uncultured organism Bio4]
MLPQHSKRYLDDQQLESDPSAPLQLFYMSFADGSKPKGQQFLGGLFIQAKSFTGAIRASHQQGLNPGGEVQAAVVQRPVESKWIGRLMSRAELEEMDREALH